MDMTTSGTRWSAGIRWLALAAVALCGIALTIGSGGGGGDGDTNGGGDTNIVGFTFTADNLVEAASLGVAPLTLFYPMSQFAAAGFRQLITAPPTPGEPFTLDGICLAGGDATLTWTDALPAGFSAGDTVVLTFTACFLEGDPDPSSIDGTITFNVTLYGDGVFGFAAPFLQAQTTIDLTIEELFEGQPIMADFTSAFLTRVFRATDTADSALAFRFGGGNAELPSNPDPAALMTVSSGGAELYKFGCFDVSLFWEPLDPVGEYLLGLSLIHI